MNKPAYTQPDQTDNEPSTKRSNARRIYLWVLRVLQWMSRPISSLKLSEKFWLGIKDINSSLFLPFASSTRKLLQNLTNRLTSTRYLVHLLMISISLGLVLGGFAQRGFIKQAQAAKPRVVSFGSQRSIVGYAPLEHGGYLIKGSSSRTGITISSTKTAREYFVQGGDTISAIASRFGVSQNTILWANQITDPSWLKPGQKLLIPPTTGIVHKVKEDQTIETIASKYDISADRIIEFNSLIPPIKLKTDQDIMIPLSDDAIPLVPQPEPEPEPIASTSTPSTESADYIQPYQPTGPIAASGQFVWPASGVIYKNFYQHRYGDGAIDISNRSAPAIVASDAGVVTVAGWGQAGYACYGNVIDIDHGNGYKTRYAHLSGIYVSPGQSVSKGQVIGQMGTTGCSTGIHLHFMIMYNGIPQNPINYLP